MQPTDELDLLELRDYTEKAYLDYSMYVINDRALPFLGDGLKPVQRRIIFAMQQLGITHEAKYAKSARTIGDVIGKYHPHGEAACYESMVVMAQPFSYRYPLVDGQGNWGAQDEPKSFAAQRYTECRLTAIASLLYKELRQGTVDFTPNFDGTISEPVAMPAQLPFLLLNGSSGIAVGMATDVLPHNLVDIVNASVAILKNSRLTLDELVDEVHGPDFPTGGCIISSREDLMRIYETGHGSIRCRAVYEVNGDEIVITELPYQSSPTKVLEQIANQMQAKKLPQLDDLRDESDHENPTRLVLIPRSKRVDIDRLMQHLFASTNLERSYRWNFNVIGSSLRPKTYSLKQFIVEWLEFRKYTVRRRITHRIAQIDRRLEIIDGLLIAHLSIEEVIRIVRWEDKPKQALIDRYQLTELQATAILDLRIRQLSRLEKDLLEKEKIELGDERSENQQLLDSTRRLNRLIEQELLDLAKKFGDSRRTKIDSEAPAAQAYSEIDLVAKEQVTVILSQKGWIKVRKGHETNPESLNYREGDSYLTSLRVRLHETCLFFDSAGRTYSLAIANLPSGKGYGEPLSMHLTPPSGARFIGLFSGQEEFALIANDGGEGFRLPLSIAQTQMKAGKAVAIFDESRALVEPCVAKIDGLVVLISRLGRILVLKPEDIPIRKKGKGVKLIGLSKQDLLDESDALQFVQSVRANEKMILNSGKRKKILRQQELLTYRGSRATRGRSLPRGFKTVDTVIVV